MPESVAPSSSTPEATSSWVSQLLGFLTVSITYRKGILIGTAIPTLLTAAIVMIVDSSYQGAATIAIPPANGGGLGNLGALTSSGIGSILGGTLGSSIDPRMESLIMSEALGTAAIRRFRLDTAWKLKPGHQWEDELKIWNSKFSYRQDDNHALCIGFVDKSPQRAAAVVNFTVDWVDSAFQAMQRQHAAKNLEFLQVVADQRFAQLAAAEDSLANFQVKNRFWAPTEQLRQSVIQAASIESELGKLDLQVQLAESSGKSQSSLSELRILQDNTRQKLARITSSQGVGRNAENGVLVKLNQGVEKDLRYERLYRQILIHQEVLKFLLQQLEQVRIQAQRNVTSVQRVDTARVPEKRFLPKRRQLVQAAFVLSLCFSLLVAFVVAHFHASSSEEDREALSRLRNAFRGSKQA